MPSQNEQNPTPLPTDMCWCGDARSRHKPKSERTDYGRDKWDHCVSCCDPESDDNTRCDHDFKIADVPLSYAALQERLAGWESECLAHLEANTRLQERLEAAEESLDRVREVRDAANANSLAWKERAEAAEAKLEERRFARGFLTADESAELQERTKAAEARTEALERAWSIYDQNERSILTDGEPMHCESKAWKPSLRRTVEETARRSLVERAEAAERLNGELVTALDFMSATFDKTHQHHEAVAEAYYEAAVAQERHVSTEDFHEGALERARALLARIEAESSNAPTTTGDN